jgi:hypothetical protein
MVASNSSYGGRKPEELALVQEQRAADYDINR